MGLSRTYATVFQCLLSGCASSSEIQTEELQWSVESGLAGQQPRDGLEVVVLVVLESMVTPTRSTLESSLAAMAIMGCPG
jgi:hypothetical protein